MCNLLVKNLFQVEFFFWFMFIWMHKRDRKFQKWVGREREVDWKKACNHETMLVSIPHLPLLVYYFLFSLSHPPLFSNCVKTLNFLLYGIRMKENWTKTNAKAMDRRGDMDGCLEEPLKSHDMYTHINLSLLVWKRWNTEKQLELVSHIHTHTWNPFTHDSIVHVL